jgi:hypothetical protein
MSQTLDTEGKRLKYVREKILNISQEVFATSIAKHSTAIQKWESGLNAIDPTFKIALEHVYGINPAWLSTGTGDMLVKRSLNVYQMPVYELSSKPYAEIFHKDNIVDNKDIVYVDKEYDLASILFVVATKTALGIEKGDLLIVSTECGKGKALSNYLVEGNGVLELRSLQVSDQNIIEFKQSKISDIQGLSLSAELVSLDKSQIKCNVIKTITAELWKKASVILI